MDLCETPGQLLELGFSSESKAQHQPSQQMVHHDVDRLGYSVAFFQISKESTSV